MRQGHEARVAAEIAAEKAAAEEKPGNTGNPSSSGSESKEAELFKGADDIFEFIRQEVPVDVDCL